MAMEDLWNRSIEELWREHEAGELLMMAVGRTSLAPDQNERELRALTDLVFRHQGRRYTLLTATERAREGDVHVVCTRTVFVRFVESLRDANDAARPWIGIKPLGPGINWLHRCSLHLHGETGLEAREPRPAWLRRMLGRGNR